MGASKWQRLYLCVASRIFSDLNMVLKNHIWRTMDLIRDLIIGLMNHKWSIMNLMRSQCIQKILGKGHFLWRVDIRWSVS